MRMLKVIPELYFSTVFLKFPNCVLFFSAAVSVSVDTTVYAPKPNRHLNRQPNIQSNNNYDDEKYSLNMNNQEHNYETLYHQRKNDSRRTECYCHVPETEK